MNECVWNGNNSFCVAANFWQLETDLRGGGDEVKKMEADVDESNAKAREAEDTIEEMNESIKKLQARETNESKELKRLEMKQEKESKELVVRSSAHMNHEKTVNTERKDLDAARSTANEANNNITKKQEQLNVMMKDVEVEERKHHQLTERLAGLQGSLLGIGMS
jgi:chromosome segregation ATPase